MKNFLKKISAWTIEAVFLPFIVTYKFIKNIDKISRAILLLVTCIFIAFIVVAKPYLILARDFRVQKYRNGEKAVAGLTKKHPLKATSFKEYETILNNTGIYCEPEKAGSHTCVGFENILFVKYKWTVDLKINSRGAVTNVIIVKEKVPGGIGSFYKKTPKTK
jgi:hypothetical protein